ncbi:hypothetical protein CapIbe_018548 [Capra ibex]
MLGQSPELSSFILILPAKNCIDKQLHLLRLRIQNSKCEKAQGRKQMFGLSYYRRGSCKCRLIQCSFLSMESEAIRTYSLEKI